MLVSGAADDGFTDEHLHRNLGFWANPESDVHVMAPTKKWCRKN